MRKGLGILLIALGIGLVIMYNVDARAKKNCLYVGIPAALVGFYLMKGGRLPIPNLTANVPDDKLKYMGLVGHLAWRKRQQGSPQPSAPASGAKGMSDAELKACWQEYMIRKKAEKASTETPQEVKPNGKPKSIQAL